MLFPTIFIVDNIVAVLLLQQLFKGRRLFAVRCYMRMCLCICVLENEELCRKMAESNWGNRVKRGKTTFSINLNGVLLFQLFYSCCFYFYYCNSCFAHKFHIRFRLVLSTRNFPKNFCCVLLLLRLANNRGFCFNIMLM